MNKLKNIKYDDIVNNDTLVNVIGVGFAIFVIGFIIWTLSYTFAQPFVEETTTTEVEVTDTTAVEITTTEAVTETTTEKPTEVTTTVITTTVVTTDPPKVAYFKVPLDEDLQDYIFEVCADYDVDPVLVMAVIKKESNFKPDTLGDSGRSYGLMQIQPRWHQARADALNCSNLTNPYHNVTVGVDILAELFDTGKSLEWVLMAYNGGASYANKKVAAGEVSDYARTVIKYMNSFKKERV